MPHNSSVLGSVTACLKAILEVFAAYVYRGAGFGGISTTSARQDTAQTCCALTLIRGNLVIRTKYGVELNIRG